MQSPGRELGLLAQLAEDAGVSIHARCYGETPPRMQGERASVRVTLKLKGTLLVTKELEPDILSMAFLMTV